MQQDLDVTLNKLDERLKELKAAFAEERKRRITDPELLDWWAKLIEDSYRGDYYHRTIKNRHSLPESENTDSPDNRASKRRRIIRTLLSCDEEMKNLYDVLKSLEGIDVRFWKMVHAQPERPMRRYLYMEKEMLFGRDKEIGQVMNFLLKPIQAGENNVSILPILGSWQRGKTSVALRCFYDSKVQDHFSLKIYLRFPCIDIKFAPSFACPCPPGYCFIHHILKEIQKQCKILKPDQSWETNYNDFNTLLAMLKQNLSSRRFLLVLDGVTGLDPKVWNDLWECLNCGAKGSKVIFVSHIFDYDKYYKNCHIGRYDNKIVCPVEMPLMIDYSSEGEYFQCFCEYPLGGAHPDEYPKLARMGKEMVKKMNGSTWAVTTLGEILRENLNAKFWSNFLQVLSDSWAISTAERQKCNGTRKPYEEDIRLVMDVMCRLLPGHLNWNSIGWRYRPLGDVKTFRELMVLGPDHCRPLIKDGCSYGVMFWVRGLGYQDDCNYFKVICNPSWVKRFATLM